MAVPKTSPVQNDVQHDNPDKDIDEAPQLTSRYAKFQNDEDKSTSSIKHVTRNKYMLSPVRVVKDRTFSQSVGHKIFVQDNDVFDAKLN